MTNTKKIGAPRGNRNAAKPDDAKKIHAAFTLSPAAVKIIETASSNLGISRSAVVELAVRKI